MALSLVPKHNICSLTLGSIKQEVFLSEGSPKVRDVIELGFSGDARRMEYDAAGRILHSLKEYLAHPNDMLTV
jgi:pyruvate/2-oxoglutarate dehydrogenase complex dihydrolipoamide acyltransferase (E2) component